MASRFQMPFCPSGMVAAYCPGAVCGSGTVVCCSGIYDIDADIGCIQERAVGQECIDGNDGLLSLLLNCQIQVLAATGSHQLPHGLGPEFSESGPGDPFGGPAIFGI